MTPADVRVNEIIAALADLSPQPSLERGAKRQIPLEWFRWMPLRSVELFGARFQTQTQSSWLASSESAAIHLQNLFVGNMTDPVATVPIEKEFADRLAVVDQIRSAEGSIRLGWLFVAGRTVDESGRKVRIFEPLVTMKVRVSRGLVQSHLVAAGDVELSSLVHDPDNRLESFFDLAVIGGAFGAIDSPSVSTELLDRMPRLQGFVREAVAAAGLSADALVPPVESPEKAMSRDGLLVIAGVGLFVDKLTTQASRASTIRSWVDTPGVENTALRHLYIEAERSGEAASRSEVSSVESSFPLTPRQREAVAAARDRPLTLLSGAPGTGKSHTVAAIALDAMERGHSVLIATRTSATVDALVDLLERVPGPEPVVFGSNERRDALVQRLASGQLRASTDGELEAARHALELRVRDRTSARAKVEAHLEAVLMATGSGTVGLDLVDRVATVDPSSVRSLLAAASEPGGWFARRRRRRALRSLAHLLAVEVDSSDLGAVRDALDVAIERREDLLTEPVVSESADDWEHLLRADDGVCKLHGRLVDLTSRSRRRLDRAGLTSITNLATALRSGRSARREQLARLTKTAITQALPLWIGTLADIDDLLPPRPSLFDLVILDEASSIDQPLAAPALLRAARAVVVGDPKQLRHVSFLADDRIQSTLSEHYLDGDPQLAALLDVRRNSLFDVAAGGVPVVELDEQFRSAPHLVDFVSHRLYGGAMEVATRNPRTESVDCVEVRRLDGHRDDAGVVVAEVDEVVARLHALRREGARSVGVVTPFRAQADAIEEAVLDAFHADDVEALDLRIGTVHAMQGNERDLVIASMGIGPEDTSSWRFVEDSHLFAVLVTRARRRFEILLSADPPESGLVADYLAQADDPPRPTRSGRDLEPWVDSIKRGVELAGVKVVAPYPAGRHRLDLCIGDDIDFIGVEARIHPDGVDAHIDRHLALRRAGWRLVEAFENRWDGQVGELAIELSNAVQARHRPKAPEPT